MTAPETKTESENYYGNGQICRLCMSEESLDDVFEDGQLKEWIWEFLAIKISDDDRMSQVVCTICRIRLTEFHQFRMGCHEVQEVLQALIPDGTGGPQSLTAVTQSATDPKATNQSQRIGSLHYTGIRCEVCQMDFRDEKQLTDHQRIHETGKNVEASPDADSELREPGYDYVGEVDNELRSKNCEEGYKCSKCDQTFICDCRLKAHMASHEEKENDASSHESSGEDETFDKSDKAVASVEKKEKQTDRGQVYQCDICQKLYTSSKKLTDHKKYHRKKLKQQAANPTNNKKKQFDTSTQCDVCQKKFSHRNHLMAHKRNMHRPKTHKCDICDIQFMRHRMQQHLYTKRHMDKVQEMQRLEDEESPNKADANQEQNMNEKKIKNPKLFHAELIAKYQTYRWNKKYDGTGPTECNLCGKKFSNRWDLASHKKTHRPRKYICNVCEKPCGSPAALKQHLVTHVPIVERRKRKPQRDIETAPRPYKCDICESAFMGKNTLNAHNRTIHAQKKIECEICGFKFATKEQLKLHLKKHVSRGHTKEDFRALKKLSQQNDESTNPKNDASDHSSVPSENETNENGNAHGGPSADQPFKCYICHKSFENAVLLYRHNRLEHRPRKFECSVCGECYSFRKQLNTHMKIHKLNSTDSTAAKEFECPHCRKIYLSWTGLYRHVRNHNARNKKISDQTFACTKCDKKFDTKPKLASHTRGLHTSAEHKCDICKKTFNLYLRLWHHMANEHGKTTSSPNSEATADVSNLEDSVQNGDETASK